MKGNRIKSKRRQMEVEGGRRKAEPEVFRTYFASSPAVAASVDKNLSGEPTCSINCRSPFALRYLGEKHKSPFAERTAKSRR